MHDAFLARLAEGGPYIDEAIVGEADLTTLRSVMGQNMRQYQVHWLASSPRCLKHVEDGLIHLISGVPIPSLNPVVTTHLSPTMADQSIEGVVARARAHRVPTSWRVDSLTYPSDLASRLQAYGFVTVGDEPCMYLDLRNMKQPATVERFCVYEVLSDRDVKSWVKFFGAPDSVHEAFLEFVRIAGFGPLGPARHFAGFIDNDQVSAVSLFLGCGVAAIYNLAVDPLHRGRGIGTATIGRACCAAQEMGYRYIVLQASRLGLGVYIRFGFCTIGVVRNYVWSSQDHTGSLPSIG